MTVDAIPAARRPLRGEIVALQVLIAILLGLRLYFDFTADLFGDEAYYWLWGQHLDWSYFDHPPLHAWLLRFVDLILGWRPISVRVLTWLTFAGTIAIFWDWSKRLAPTDPQLWFWRTTAIYSASLLFFAMTTVAYNDHLLVFCSLLAVHCFLIFAERAETGAANATRWLYLAGFAAGLAALSKYNGIFITIGFAITLRLQLRPWLATPHPWLAALLALATQAPVLYWNLSRGMASFRFHLNERWNGDAGTFHPTHPLTFIILVVVSWSPFLIWPLVRLIRSAPQTGFEDRARTLTLSIFFFSTLTMLILSMIIDAFFYWNIVALVGLTPLLTLMGAPLRWTHLLYGLVGAVLVVLNFTIAPINTFRGTLDYGSAINFGWDEVRDHVLAVEAKTPTDTVGAPRYSTASQLGFALGITDPVRYVSEERSEYQYWQADRPLAGTSGLILVDDHDAAAQMGEIKPHFATLTQVDRFSIIRLGRPIYAWRLYRGEGYIP